MKNRAFFIILISILLTSVTSCRKVIDFSGEITDPYLVMVSQPQADSVWTVRVSQSRFFLNNDTIPLIANAQVYMMVNGENANGMATYLGDGRYTSGIRPKPGDSLSLRVVVPERGEMTAGCRVPTQPVVSDAEIIIDTTMECQIWTDYNDSTHYEYYVNGDAVFKIKIHDPADQKNYYMLRVARILDDDDPDYLYITVDDNVLFDIDATEEVFDLGLQDDGSYGNRVMFTDERINGTTHTVSARVYYGSVTSFDYGNPTSFSLNPTQIEVYSISRDLYLYLKTVKAAESQDEFTQIFSEPVQIYSNVNGGIGILGAASKSVIKLQTSKKKDV